MLILARSLQFYTYDEVSSSKRYDRVPRRVPNFVKGAPQGIFQGILLDNARAAETAPAQPALEDLPQADQDLIRNVHFPKCVVIADKEDAKDRRGRYSMRFFSVERVETVRRWLMTKTGGEQVAIVGYANEINISKICDANGFVVLTYSIITASGHV